jgi:hypothetical protein
MENRAYFAQALSGKNTLNLNNLNMSTIKAGSRTLRRKAPADPDVMVVNTYWFPHTLSRVKNLLADLQEQGSKQAVLYGEVYGQGVQAYTYSDGDSLIGGNHGREGVVVKPIVERDDPKLGRVILKYIGDHYLFGKVAEQDTTDV